MPTYQYLCRKCGMQEIFQTMKEESLTTCPLCGSISFNKIFNAVGISFKGKGFYSTDKGSK